MRQALRENALCAFAAMTGCATIAWLGLYGFAWNDYELEAQPSFEALEHGHLLEFLKLAPAYGGSLVERAPFALLPGLWGGGQLAVYRMVALPCLLAAVVLAVWLCARMRAAGHSTLSRAVALGVCAANPLTLLALEYGHPEEILGGCLCVAAVIVAGRPSLGRRHGLWAGVLLGLAIANKPWALLAVGPVLLALVTSSGAWPWRRAMICLASTAAVAALVLAPLTIVSRGGIETSALGVPPQEIFQPWQLWWLLGSSNHVHAAQGGAARSVPADAPLSTRPEWRLSPAWLSGVAHPLIVLLALPLTLLAWLRRRRVENVSLRLLALLLLLRCVLDPWDISYYMLPFALALLAWEVSAHRSRPPVLALAITTLAWISFQWLPAHVSPDVQSTFFLAWSLPLAGALAARLFGPGRRRRTRSTQPDPTWISMPAR